MTHRLRTTVLGCFELQRSFMLWVAVITFSCVLVEELQPLGSKSMALQTVMIIIRGRIRA